jgi:molybdopterin molybdotransferase
MAFGRIVSGTSAAWLFGLPGNPVAVMVTFYQFVRPALLFMAGMTRTEMPLLAAVSAQPIRKVPGRTEYQRGIVFHEGGVCKVRTTGQQGSGVLRSMSEANCFIVLEHERGAVQAGETVQVQLFEGLT